MPKHKIRESFSWLAPEAFKVVQDTGRNKVRVKGIALRGNMVSRNKRKYVDEELDKRGATLTGQKVTVNHNDRNIIGNVDYAHYEDGALEYLMTVNKQPYVKWLREKDPRIKGVSVQAGYLFNKCVECGQKFYSEDSFWEHMAKKHFVKRGESMTEPHGITFDALSLVVEPEVPGVPGTSTELWETLQKSTPLKLLEIVTTVKKEQNEWRQKMEKAATTSTPKRIGIGKGKPPKLKEQEEEKDEHGCVKGKEEWKDGKCVAIQKATEQDQTVQDLPEPTVEAPTECPMGFEPDGVGGCKPKEWQAEPTADTPAPLMVPEPTIEPPKVVDPTLVAPAVAAGPLIEQEEGEHSVLPPAPFPTTPAEAPASVTEECPAGSHWDKIGGTCVPDEIVEQPPGLEGRVDAGASIVSEVRLPKLLKLGEPFANYKDFADCVAKNPDKEDPEAYCASIKQQVEGETVKETKGDIYKRLDKVQNRSIAQSSQIAESVNQLNTGVASLTKTVAQLPHKTNKQLLMEARLRGRDNQILRNGINKYAKGLNETIVKLNVGNKQTMTTSMKTIQETINTGFESINEYMKNVSEASNKNTRYVNTKLSQLATALVKTEKKLKEVLKAQDGKIESQKKDYEKVAHLIEKVKDDEVKSLKQQMKEQEDELDKRKCGPDEHYSEEEGKCVPNKPKEPEETSETKKLIETLTTKVDNLESKLKGDFKGKSQQVKKDTPAYEDPYKGKTKAK